MDKKLNRRLSLSLTQDEYNWIAKRAEWNHITIAAYCRQSLLSKYHPSKAKKMIRR